MAKPSKRAGRGARDVHATIRADAESLKTSGRIGFHDAAEFPELAALLQAAFDAVAAGAPRYVFHKGRTYWLRVRLAAKLDVYAAPGDAAPLLRGANFSTDAHTATRPIEGAATTPAR